jgi:hypothetical protein
MTVRKSPRGIGALADRFWAAVQKTESCWLWTGKKCPDGYGNMVHQRKVWGTHRVSWLLHNGAIPDGMCVLHRCDNPPCVNPAHLFLGTHRENIADCVAKGRNSTAGFRGERHHRARVGVADVIEIRRLATTGVSLNAVARQYGVTDSSIRHIVHRRSWRHVPEPPFGAT